MDAGLGDPLFWGSLALALGDRLGRCVPGEHAGSSRAGEGHAVVHDMHHYDLVETRRAGP